MEPDQLHAQLLTLVQAESRVRDELVGALLSRTRPAWVWAGCPTLRLTRWFESSAEDISECLTDRQAIEVLCRVLNSDFQTDANCRPSGITVVQCPGVITIDTNEWSLINRFNEIRSHIKTLHSQLNKDLCLVNSPESGQHMVLKRKLVALQGWQQYKWHPTHGTRTFRLIDQVPVTIGFTYATNTLVFRLSATKTVTWLERLITSARGNRASMKEEVDRTLNYVKHIAKGDPTVSFARRISCTPVFTANVALSDPVCGRLPFRSMHVSLPLMILGNELPSDLHPPRMPKNQSRRKRKINRPFHAGGILRQPLKEKALSSALGLYEYQTESEIDPQLGLFG